jgi:hypothetical protein
MEASLTIHTFNNRRLISDSYQYSSATALLQNSANVPREPTKHSHARKYPQTHIRTNISTHKNNNTQTQASTHTHMHTHTHLSDQVVLYPPDALHVGHVAILLRVLHPKQCYKQAAIFSAVKEQECVGRRIVNDRTRKTSALAISPAPAALLKHNTATSAQANCK